MSPGVACCVFGRQPAEVVGWVGVGMSRVVLLRGDRATEAVRLGSLWLSLWRLRRPGSRRGRQPGSAVLVVGGREAQRGLLPADDAWAQRWRRMWTCDHYSGWSGHFLDRNFGHPSVVGCCLDCLTPFAMESLERYAFSISGRKRKALPFRLIASRSVSMPWRRLPLAIIH